MSNTADKLVYGSSFKLIHYLVNVAVTFFLMPFVLSSLGDRLYGFWTLLGTFIGYYGVLDFGLSSAVSRYVAGSIGAGDVEESNKIITTALLIFSGLGFLILSITVCLSVFSPIIISNLDDAIIFRKAILILGINIAIDFPLRVFGGLLYAQLKFSVDAILHIMTLFIRTILIIWALSMGYKIIALAWITVLASLPSRALYLYLAKKYLPSLKISLRYWSRRCLKLLLEYGLYAFIAQLASILRFKLDVFVITAFIGLMSVTHYRVASVMVEYFFSIMLAITGVLTPVFSRFYAVKDHQRLRKLIILSTKISICISSFIVFGFIAWGKPFITRWLGAQYTDAYPPLIVLSLGALCSLAQLPSVNFLFGTTKHKFFAWSNIVEGIINVVLSVLLVQKFGILGVALGTMIPMAIIKIFIQPVYVCRVASMEYTDYIKECGKTLLFAILALLLPLIIAVKFCVPSYHSLIMVGISSLLLYSAVIWQFAFNSRERKTLLPFQFS
jgi:O-antigen/teichoic acid export membrane protein